MLTLKVLPYLPNLITVEEMLKGTREDTHTEVEIQSIVPLLEEVDTVGTQHL